MKRLLLGLVLASTCLAWLAPQAGAYVWWGHWSNQSGVGRAGLDGSGAQDAFIPAAPGPIANARGVAADATNVFWGANRTNDNVAAAVGRAGLDGFGANPAFTAGSGLTITGMAVSPTYVYWTADNSSTGEVGRTPIAGGQGVESFSSNALDPHPHPCGIAVDDTYVYWANRATSTIGRAAIASFGTVGTVDGDWLKLGDDVHPCGVAVDDTFVYWGVYETDDTMLGTVPGTTIGRARKADGGDATNAFIGGTKMVSGIAVDGSFIYWSNFTSFAPDLGSIGRANRDGTGVDQAFVSGLDSPFGVAVDPSGPTPAPPTPNTPLPTPPSTLPVGVNLQNPSGGGLAPQFTSLHVTHDVWAPIPKDTPLTGFPVHTARAVPRGTTFSFKLDKAATAKIALMRTAPGRKVGRTCKPPKPRLAKKKACKRLVTAAPTLTRTAKAGVSQVPFTGRIKGKTLKPGRYTAVFTAKPAGGGKTSKAATLTFRIVKP